MNQYVTGAVIKELREKYHLTQAEETDENHMVFIEQIEDEYYIRVEHDMTKQHYISFIVGLASDKVQMIKLYPEGNAEARLKINGVKRILFYCNRDGLFSITPVKGIDDKQFMEMTVGTG